ncbi:hypothetical protein DVH26_00715 [Paenibacillus sp. H1-7]|nr:hypothetical protein DVH26_00715 [Paenibacillus sp. H1-7]
MTRMQRNITAFSLFRCHTTLQPSAPFTAQQQHQLIDLGAAGLGFLRTRNKPAPRAPELASSGCSQGHAEYYGRVAVMGNPNLFRGDAPLMLLISICV